MNTVTYGKFCILQDFRKYKNERFYMASADSNPILPVQIWCKKVTRLFSSE
jgi:hypothetical protein